MHNVEYYQHLLCVLQSYHHGETIAVNISIRNNSNKLVKKIKAMVQQGVDIMLFQNGQYRSSVASLETQ
jgi:arrestin-1